MKRKASLPASPNPTPVSRDALAGALTEFLVAPLPPAHALLLNKFPIVGAYASPVTPSHCPIAALSAAKSAIIATTAFEPQELPLTLQDVWALWAV